MDFNSPNGEVICLCYVDDCLWYSKLEKAIRNIIADLKKPHKQSHLTMKLEAESDATRFLGIDIQKHRNGTIKLLQT